MVIVILERMIVLWNLSNQVLDRRLGGPGIHHEETTLRRAIPDKNRAVGVPLKRGKINITDRNIRPCCPFR